MTPAQTFADFVEAAETAVAGNRTKRDALVERVRRRFGESVAVSQAREIDNWVSKRLAGWVPKQLRKVRQ